MIDFVLRSQGFVFPFELKSLKRPIKVYWYLKDRINVLIMPFKELYILDLLTSLRSFYRFFGVIRGKERFEIEGISFERSDRFEVYLSFERKKLFEGREVFDLKRKEKKFFGSFYLDALKIEKWLVIISNDNIYFSILDGINELRKKKIVVVESGRSPEKAFSISREAGYDYVLFIDNYLLKEGKGILYDVNMQRKKEIKLPWLL